MYYCSKVKSVCEKLGIFCNHDNDCWYLGEIARGVQVEGDNSNDRNSDVIYLIYLRPEHIHLLPDVILPEKRNEGLTQTSSYLTAMEMRKLKVVW